MIHTGEDCEGVERVQLDDYDDYLLDPLDEDLDTTMGIEFPENIKIEDAVDRQKECSKLINAKHAEHKHRTVETNQRGSGNLYTPPRATSALSSMLARTPAMSSLPGSRSVKEWKTTAPPIIKSLSTIGRQLGSASYKLGNNPPVERRLSVRRNDSMKPSTGDAVAPEEQAFRV
jgi:hypothetical protein